MSFSFRVGSLPRLGHFSAGAICILLLAAHPSALPAQAAKPVRATDSQQQDIELAAARALQPLLAEERIFKQSDRIALDPRLYANWYDMILLREGNHITSPESMSAASHTKAHLQDLVSALGVREVLEEKGVCVVSAPTRCRIARYAGLVVISPAVLMADSALIAVKVAVPLDSPREPEMVGISVFTVVLVADAARWIVRRIERTSVH